MNKDDARKFSECITTLEKYFEKTLDERVKLLYLEGLSDLEIGEIDRATRRAVATLKFFPKISELRELVEGTKEDRAAIAWETAQQAHRRAGAWTSILFTDAATGEALKTCFGGWVEFCESLHQVWAAEASFEDREAARLERREAEGHRRLVSGLSDEMIAAKRKEFLIAYRNAERAGRRGFCYLPGQHEIENRRTAGTWTRGEVGSIFRQQVYIADNLGGYFVWAAFDTATAQLVGGAPSLLKAQPVSLPARPAPKLLRSAPGEEIPVTEAKGLIAEAVKDLSEAWRMPAIERQALSQDQYDARLEELRKQAERICASE